MVIISLLRILSSLRSPSSSHIGTWLCYTGIRGHARTTWSLSSCTSIQSATHSSQLKFYKQTEHIDNPKGYAEGEDARAYHPNLRGPVDVCPYSFFLPSNSFYLS